MAFSVLALVLVAGQAMALELQHPALDAAGTIGISGYGAVAFWNSQIVAGNGTRLEVTDPFNPAGIPRTLDLPGIVVDIKMWGDVAVVGTPNGVAIVDLAAVDWQVYQIDVHASRITISGDLAIVSSSSGLQIIQLDAPNPEVIASVDFGWSNTRSLPIPVASSQRFVFALEYDVYYDWATLWVVDLDDPSAPVVTDHFWMDGCDDLIVVEQHLFGIGSQLQVIDISAPMQPTLIRQLDISGERAAFVGDIMTIADRESVTTLDITDRESPIVLSSLESQYQPWGLACDTGATVVAQGWAGLLVINAENPNDLVAGERSGTEFGHIAITGAVKQGDRVITAGSCAEPGPDGPTSGDCVAAYSAENQSFINSLADISALNLKSYDELVFALDRGELAIMDFSDPNSPAILSRLGLPGTVSRPHAFALDDGVVFIGLGSFLHVIDVVDATHPNQIVRIEMDVYPESMAVTRDHKLIVGGGGRLLVFDVLNPASPLFLQSFEPGPSAGLEALSGVPFIAAGDVGVAAILCEFQIDTPWEFSIPNCILVQAQFDEDGGLQEIGRASFRSDSDFRPTVALGRDYAVVTRPAKIINEASVLLYDLRCPDRLRLLSSARIGDSPSTVALSDDVAIVVDGSALGQIYNVQADRLICEAFERVALR